MLARLIGLLGDLDVAEEALADACLQTVRRWPTDGIPDHPAAWLATVARNAAIDRIHHLRTAGHAGGPGPLPAGSGSDHRGAPAGHRRRRPPGLPVLQAAIAAVHADAPTAQATDWPQIASLYGLLAQPGPALEPPRPSADSRPGRMPHAFGPQALKALGRLPLRTPGPAPDRRSLSSGFHRNSPIGSRSASAVCREI
ncbi:sigma factor [Streptomyces mirabilis]|uniref:sigma factor n=1 Tax=Streptomyces mirabilis TaxID=68239 RepID=UPI0036C76FE4